jgi:DNA-binding NarL/FixJ family response regulator
MSYVMPSRILIADDDPTIRLLLRRLLEKEAGCEVCAEASNGLEAIEKVKQIDPDLVVMDLSMPVMTGLQAAPAIVEARPLLPMLLITVEEVSHELARVAHSVGYRGVVSKSNGVEVLNGIHALLRDESLFCSRGSAKSAELEERNRSKSPKFHETLVDADEGIATIICEFAKSLGIEVRCKAR